MSPWITFDGKSLRRNGANANSRSPSAGRHGGPESEHLGGAGGVGDDVADVAAAVLAGDHRRRTAAGVAHQRAATSRIEIGCPEQTLNAANPPRLGVERRDVGGRDVVDVDEVAHLAAVLENPWRLAPFDGGPEDRRDARIRGVARHVGP